MRRPTCALKADCFSTVRAGTFCVAAFSVVSSTNCDGIPCTSAASVAIRVAEMSAFGDTRS